MNLSLSKKQIVTLLIMGGLIVVLALTISLTQKKQEIRKKAAGTGVVKLTLSPSGITKDRGEAIDFSVQLISSEVKRVSAAGFDLQFSTNVFEISSVACSSFLPNSQAARVIDNKIYISCYVPGGTTDYPELGVDLPVTLGTFRATVRSDAPFGNTQISFTRTYVAEATGDATDISDAGTTATYTISGAEVTGTPTPTTSPVPTATSAPIPTATATPIPTATGTPRPTATVTPRPTAIPTVPPGDVQVRFRIKFAGIDQRRADQNIRVKVLKDGVLKQELPFNKVSVFAGTSGVYQSDFITLSSAVTAGQGYTFLVKGPKHLQTLYCAGSGQRRPCDLRLIHNFISLNNGLNTLDFTNHPLPAGDLPHPTYGQDGVVNSIDATLLVRCFEDPKGLTCLSQADLNLDGIINVFDMEIMNLTIYSRWEDE